MGRDGGTRVSADWRGSQAFWWFSLVLPRKKVCECGIGGWEVQGETPAVKNSEPVQATKIEWIDTI